jgi:sortase (surface protein transpeptidase)
MIRPVLPLLPVLPEVDSRRSRRWWAGTVVLLVLAAGAVTVGVRGLDDPPARAVSAGPAVQSAPADTAGDAGDPVPVAPHAPPAELRIPAIGLSVSVGSLGLNDDRTVEVPTDFAEPGWFRLGPPPGDIGSAVILGHVDSVDGPAAFYRLKELTVGDEVEVASVDGAISRFAVTEVATYPKEQFPAERVYAPHGGSELQLVTCGGEFDHRAHSYRSNVVVYTSLVADTL